MSTDNSDQENSVSQDDKLDATGHMVVAVGAASLNILAALHAASFEDVGDDPWDAVAFARMIAMPGCTALLVCVPGDKPKALVPVGFAVFRVAADEAELLTIGVLPGARRKGAAESVMRHIERSAVAGGARHLILEVAQDNMAARQFYLRLGFKQVGQRPDYYSRANGPRVTAYILRRDLNENEQKASN